MNVFIRYGGKRGRRLILRESPDRVVVRTRDRVPLAQAPGIGGVEVGAASHAALGGFVSEVRYEHAGVEVFRFMGPRTARQARNRARTALKKEKTLEFAGRCLADPVSGRPVVYTENLFVKFGDDVGARAAARKIKELGLEIKRELTYARNAWFVGAPEGTGLEVFRIAEALLGDEAVELCHPELARPRRIRGAFPQQWHLAAATIGGSAVDAHSNVVSAWQLSEGADTTIAVIDDGVDIDHEEFRGAGKVVSGRDVTLDLDDPRPKLPRNRHGTACAGVACASGTAGASGVAPRARLMPIRLESGLGTQPEADAFVWAADHGADVISCSWGPEDGDFTDPGDPLHQAVAPLPDSTRLAIEYAVREGRGGKGCLVLFAAGNGNESVDNDGYASFEKVVAVAASNDRGKKALYSDFGAAVFCAFPSSHGAPSLTPGIWTVDRSAGAGYNPGGNASAGDLAGHYTNRFGGTSSACPGAAGVAALVLARNPALRWDEVRDVLRRSADRIDPQGGAYDAAGRSALYGFGRLNARAAVDLALPAGPDPVQIRTAAQDVPISDLGKASLSIAVADTKALAAFAVEVVLDHTWVGDLTVSLRPPPALGLGLIELQKHQDGPAKSLDRRYDTLTTPALADLVGQSPLGNWKLEVSDDVAADAGTLRRFSLFLTF